MRPYPGLVDLQFLSYALSDFDVSIFNFASAQAKLNQNNARKIAFPLPPIHEQRHMVAYLDSVQARVDALMRCERRRRRS
ncbi:MAG TPA: restriction endonuclease subunit S [Ktedonobacterales bacterium]|nr:restriction endonuclease subunit S [Ktedonobacterales bacterium]